MIHLEDAPASPVSPVIDYRSIPWADGYRFGEDGSAWTCRVRGSMGTDWHRMKTYPRSDGYPSLNICVAGGGRKPFYLHALICEAFHGPRPQGMEVLHDPDRTITNCRADNLRWGTSAENKADSERHGTRAKGERNGRAKLAAEDIPDIRRMYGTVRTREIADLYGVDPKLIRQIGDRKLWKHID